MRTSKQVALQRSKKPSGVQSVETGLRVLTAFMGSTRSRC